MADSPWPLLKTLSQGAIETTALVDQNGLVVARVSSPEAYQGDLRTAVERGDLTAEIVSAAAAAPDLYAALEAYHKHFGPLEDNHMLHPDCRRCAAMARAAFSKIRR